MLANTHRHLLLAIFVMSGFAGLLYQSIWSHYIGLFLGHAAYAQALVLALFMGGMAIGAAWIAKVGERWRNLIRSYAAIELAIGILGLAFHVIFTSVMHLSYDVLIPATHSSAAITALKWLLAGMMILPQTILLGMTFPLMSGGLIRRFPGRDGSLLGSLYFTNSMGAAFGALMSAFVLLPSVGLPGTTMTAGLLNIFVAIFAWSLARGSEPSPASQTAAPNQSSDQTSQGPGLLRFVLWAAALSGAASFVYEIVWIRMLSMAVGSTLQAFELMLASFIAGIALGGLWISRRADQTPDSLRLVGWMQVFMGLAALMSLAFYANAFEWVGWLMNSLSRSSGGYTLFNAGTAGISILIMLPAAFFAGTTLPLFTVTLLRAGFGERSIGRVYAWNTMGSIAGVFLAIHLLIPMLGIKLALCIGALIDMGIGLVILRSRVDSTRSMGRFAFAGLLAALCTALAVTQVKFDPMRLASGVYRHGRTQLDSSDRVVYYRDGKTASVSVIASASGATRIATNGKVDAAATTADGVGPQYDEPTMALLAALPLALHSDPQRIGVIGFGSGMSTHTLLGDSRVARVDTVEIEKAMVEGARAFGKRVERAYNDPRSNIVIDDAKAYFASQKGGYDIIISEPSNPWISGVGSLFSEEFYRFIPRQLKADGLFVQWVQLYEIDDELVASILNALTPSFGDYAAWLANESDLIIIATQAERLPEADYRRVLSGTLGSELRYLGIERTEQLALKKVANGRLLRALGRVHGNVSNSDYFPLLSLHAPKTRFLNQWATSLTTLPLLDYPLLEALGIREPLHGESKRTNLYPAEMEAWQAQQIIHFLLAPDSTPSPLPLDERARLSQLLALGEVCSATQESRHELLTRLIQLSTQTITRLPYESLQTLWQRPEWKACATKDPVFRAAIDVLDATTSREPEAMRAAGEAWFALRENDRHAEAAVVDETALFSVLLAEVRLRNWDAIRQIEANLGARVNSSEKGLRLRSLLLALADE